MMYAPSMDVLTLSRHGDETLLHPVLTRNGKRILKPEASPPRLDPMRAVYLRRVDY